MAAILKSAVTDLLTEHLQDEYKQWEDSLNAAAKKGLDYNHAVSVAVRGKLLRPQVLEKLRKEYALAGWKFEYISDQFDGDFIRLS